MRHQHRRVPGTVSSIKSVHHDQCHLVTFVRADWLSVSLHRAPWSFLQDKRGSTRVSWRVQRLVESMREPSGAWTFIRGRIMTREDLFSPIANQSRESHRCDAYKWYLMLVWIPYFQWRMCQSVRKIYYLHRTNVRSALITRSFYCVERFRIPKVHFVACFTSYLYVVYKKSL
jgi:hypothetical protein